MAQTPETIGIIAGSRALPLTFAKEVRAAGAKRIVAVAFDNETDPALAKLVDEIVWIKVGQLSKMISAFQDRGVKKCVMLGQIAPRNLFDVRPDMRALGLLMKLKQRNAHTIFGGIANELQKDGVEVIEPIPWLRSMMPGAGFTLGPKLSADQKEDVEYGFRIAKEVSKLEIGQTVVVREGTVMAVEGFEGTDACLRRGGELAQGKGAVAVKVAKEKHDLRFDIPTVGARTMETCQSAKISVLVFEATKTLLIEQPEVEALARKHKITVAAWGA